MNRGLAPGDLLEVILAGHGAWVAMRGNDVLHRKAPCLLGELFRWEPGVDYERFLRGRTRKDVAVDLAIQLDLDDAQLPHISVCIRSGTQRGGRLRDTAAGGVPFLDVRLHPPSLEKAIRPGVQ